MHYNLVHTLSLAEGFDLCGISRCRPMVEHENFLHSFLEQHYHGTLGYLERNAEKRVDPSLLVDGAQTVISCAVNYNNLAWQGNPKVASYSLAADYHNSIKDMLRNLFAKLKQHYPQLEGRAFVDTAPILEKAWAVESGLGWIGRNSLLITPQYGSFVLLGELMVNLPMDRYSSPISGGCGECRRCMEACPTQAIVAQRVIDTRRCISRLTVESVVGECDRGIDLNGWLFGCDVCQSVCPYNQNRPKYSNERFAPLIDVNSVDDKFWSSLSREQFEELFSRSAMSRGGYDAMIARIKKIENQ